MTQQGAIAGRFSGLTAIITGAGSGIGRATALQMLAEGARVIATDISADRLESLRSESRNDRLITVSGDASIQQTVDRVLEAAANRVDILANIAGIMDRFLPLGEVDDETWDRVFAVNVTAVMRLTRAVLPLMLAAGKGSIVNVASEAALRGSTAGAAYTASKHAVVGLTKNTSFMYSPLGIRANAVAPGPVDTAIGLPVTSELALKRIENLMPAVLPPVVPPAILASHICWLASDDAANITGVVLPSDGGWSAI